MASPLTDWARQYYVPGGKNAFLFYVVFGDVDTTVSPSRQAYRSDGIPEGIELMSYGPTSNAEVVDQFREGYLWNELADNNPALAAEVAAQTSCLVLKGEVADPPSLNYLRDVVGLLTFLITEGSQSTTRKGLPGGHHLPGVVTFLMPDPRHRTITWSFWLQRTLRVRSGFIPAG